MAPPGNDERDDQMTDNSTADETGADSERTDESRPDESPDRRYTGEQPAESPDRERTPNPAAGLHEGERLRPQQEMRSSGNRRGGPSRARDPVQESFSGEVDLYEIASWEVRSPLDRVAVRVTNLLESSKRVLLVAIALTLFVLQIAAAGFLVLEIPILGGLAVASAIPALVLAGYFWYGDPTAREPLVGLAVTFLLAVGFASFAGVVNSLAQPFFQAFGVVGVALFYFLIVGPIEETVKWLAVRVYAYRTDAFQTVVDGVVYGAMAGVGFAAIENLLYIMMVSVEMTATGFAVEEATAIAIATQRAFVGPGHVIFSAWAGFYLGLAKFNQGKRGPIVVKGLLIAAFIHALYNTLVTNLPLTLLSFIGFLLVYHGFWFALLYRKIRSYRSLYRRRNSPVR